MNWYDLLSGLALLHAIMATVAVTTGVLSRRERFRQAALGLLIAVCIMQTGVVAAELARHDLASLPRFVYVNGLAWILAVISLAAWRSGRFAGMGLICTPFTLVTMLTALLFGDQTALPRATGNFFTLHVGCVFLALACMTLSCGAGMLFLIQERSLKSKAPPTGFYRDLPALSGLDRLNGLSSLFGFPLYSLGLLFGMVSARLAWGTLLSGDPKELISLLIWGLYACLFHQRLAGGWRGRKPALLGIAVFAAALFSLCVVNTLMPTHHSFLAR